MDFSDEKIIEGCLKRDNLFREALYHKYSGEIYARILRYTRNKADADDIMQETFIHVFSHIGQFKKKSGLGTWIHSIAIHEVAAFYKIKDRYLLGETSVEKKMRQQPEEKADEEEISMKRLFSYNTLLEIIQQLPDGYRMMFNLCEMDGYSSEEAAKLLHCSPENCRSQLSRAKKQLREIINSIKQKKLQDE